jgi:hypothetical protein
LTFRRRPWSARLRAEHRQGEVLAKVGKRGRPKKNRQGDGLIPEELGGTRKRQNVSRRSQQKARVPWKEIEARIDSAARKKWCQRGTVFGEDPGGVGGRMGA